MPSTAWSGGHHAAAAMLTGGGVCGGTITLCVLIINTLTVTWELCGGQCCACTGTGAAASFPGRDGGTTAGSATRQLLSGSAVACTGPGWLQVLTGGGGMRLAGSGGSGDGARWRVFISHTSELRDFPEGTSYVAAVERAISAAGHVIVDMADFAAADQAPAQVCAERVRGCDVYVGVLGTRYGSPVRDRPEVSYTELEFDTATEAGLDRLVFLLDTDADDVGIPLSALIDREFGARQDAFRRRVQDSGLTTQSFANPDALGQLVERSLRDLADTRAADRQRDRARAGPGRAAAGAGVEVRQPAAGDGAGLVPGPAGGDGPAGQVCDRPGDPAGDRDRPRRDRQDRDGVPAAQGAGGRPDPGRGRRPRQRSRWAGSCT